MQAELIAALGDKVVFFYAQQHGMGTKENCRRSRSSCRCPAAGELDFGPLVAALKKIDYRGFTEIFMHPVPRGVPILETTEKITEEINRSRDYLEGLVEEVWEWRGTLRRSPSCGNDGALPSI